MAKSQKKNKKENKDGLEKQLQEAEEKYRRALADYQNLQRRTEKEKQDFLKFATSNLVAKLLIILDGLETTQKHLKDQGLDLLIKEFQEILKQEGVVVIKSLGEKFDPEVHECLEVVKVKDKKGEGRVIEEVCKGYQMRVDETSQVLRYSQVRVGKKATG